MTSQESLKRSVEDAKAMRRELLRQAATTSDSAKARQDAIHDSLTELEASISDMFADLAALEGPQS